MRKRIIIFIPAYNAETTILDTLKAVDEAILHYGVEIPVIVVNDCSTDKTGLVIQSFVEVKTYFIYEENSENRGERGTIEYYFEELRLQYDWVFLIHADDIPKKEWISTMAKVISDVNDSEYFTVWSSYDNLLHENGKIIGGDNQGDIVMNNWTPKDAANFLAKITASYHVSGAAINLKLYFQIGGFKAFLQQYGDSVFYASGILKGYKDVYIRQTLTYYRIIKSSVSFVSKRTNRDIKEIIYIIDTFSSILTPYHIKKIKSFARNLLIRRFVKSMLSLNFVFMWNNFKWIIRLGI
ncbi:MAG TPA: hypothetical protein DCQ29_12665 [Chitinophagaceae bacterium]|nr:hypothetical protein [Chitinophagaceae bacterium]